MAHPMAPVPLANRPGLTSHVTCRTGVTVGFVSGNSPSVKETYMTTSTDRAETGQKVFEISG